MPAAFTVSPADPAVLRYTRDPVEVAFRNGLNPTSISANTVRLRLGGYPVSGSVEASEDAIRFRPELPWGAGAMYTLELTSGIETAEGSGFAGANIPLAMPDGQWNSRQLVVVSALGYLDPQLAVAPTGVAAIAATVAFDVPDPSLTYLPLGQIFATRFGLAEGWDELAAVSGEGNDAYRPVLALNRGGEMIVAWDRYLFPGNLVTSAHYSTETGWQSALFPDQSSLGFTTPALVLDDAGRGAAAVHNGEQLHVYSVRVGDVEWTSQSTTPEGSVASAPHVVWTGATAGFAMLWQQDNRILAGSATFLASARPLSGEGVSVGHAALAGELQHGALLAVWEQLEGDMSQLWAAHRAEGAFEWSVPEPISVGAGSATAPVAALAWNGRAVVVWVHADAEDARLFGATFVPGEGWSSPVAISEGAPAAAPAVALDPGGQGFVLWQELDENGTPAALWSSRYLTDRGFLAPERRFSGGTALTAPDVGVDGAGRAFATFGTTDALTILRFE